MVTANEDTVVEGEKTRSPPTRLCVFSFKDGDTFRRRSFLIFTKRLLVVSPRSLIKKHSAGDFPIGILSLSFTWCVRLCLSFIGDLFLYPSLEDTKERLETKAHHVSEANPNRKIAWSPLRATDNFSQPLSPWISWSQDSQPLAEELERYLVEIHGNGCKLSVALARSAWKGSTAPNQMVLPSFPLLAQGRPCFFLQGKMFFPFWHSFWPFSNHFLLSTWLPLPSLPINQGLA